MYFVLLLEVSMTFGNDSGSGGRNVHGNGKGNRKYMVIVMIMLLTMVNAASPSYGGMFARRATFVLRILSLAPSLSSPWEVPQVDCTRPQTISARHLV